MQTCFLRPSWRRSCAISSFRKLETEYSDHLLAHILCDTYRALNEVLAETSKALGVSKPAKCMSQD